MEKQNTLELPKEVAAVLKNAPVIARKELDREKRTHIYLDEAGNDITEDVINHHKAKEIRHLAFRLAAYGYKITKITKKKGND